MRNASVSTVNSPEMEQDPMVLAPLTVSLACLWSVENFSQRIIRSEKRGNKGKSSEETK